MSITLDPLPYGKDALSPYISSETLSFHHDKHHATYCNNLNNLIKDTELDSKTLEEIIMLSHADASKTAIFNNAAQVWNHTFYFKCMHSNGGDEPALAIIEKINQNFGSFQEFKDAFKLAAMQQFGSGWAWLVQNPQDGQLKIVKTANAGNPMTDGLKPLLTVDVWEHAYYLDYQNRRADYLDVFLSKLVNWDFVSSQMDS